MDENEIVKADSHDDNDDDCQEYFLQSTPGPYDIHEKIRTANNELFEDYEAYKSVIREQRVTFREELVDYEPDYSSDDGYVHSPDALSIISDNEPEPHELEYNSADYDSFHPDTVLPEHEICCSENSPFLDISPSLISYEIATEINQEIITANDVLCSQNLTEEPFSLEKRETEETGVKITEIIEENEDDATKNEEETDAVEEEQEKNHEEDSEENTVQQKQEEKCFEDNLDFKKIENKCTEQDTITEHTEEEYLQENWEDNVFERNEEEDYAEENTCLKSNEQECSEENVINEKNANGNETGQKYLEENAVKENSITNSEESMTQRYTEKTLERCKSMQIEDSFEEDSDESTIKDISKGEDAFRKKEQTEYTLENVSGSIGSNEVLGEKNIRSKGWNNYLEKSAIRRRRVEDFFEENMIRMKKGKNFQEENGINIKEGAKYIEYMLQTREGTKTKMEESIKENVGKKERKKRLERSEKSKEGYFEESMNGWKVEENKHSEEYSWEKSREEYLEEKWNECEEEEDNFQENTIKEECVEESEDDNVITENEDSIIQEEDTEECIENEEEIEENLEEDTVEVIEIINDEEDLSDSSTHDSSEDVIVSPSLEEENCEENLQTDKSDNKKGNLKAQPVNCRIHCLEKKELDFLTGTQKLKSSKGPLLKLRPRPCCTNQQFKPKLPVYNGLISEYGLTKTQLERRQRRKEKSAQRKKEKSIRISEEKRQKDLFNEEVFCAWVASLRHRNSNKENQKTKNTSQENKPRPKTASCMLHSENKSKQKRLNTSPYKGYSCTIIFD